MWRIMTTILSLKRQRFQKMWWSHQHKHSLNNTGWFFPPRITPPAASTGLQACHSDTVAVDPFQRLTCDHAPAVQTAGQLWVLQACRLAGVGWAQRESGRSSTSARLVLWTHWAFLVCSPPPQLRLHTPQSPTDQLEQHNTASWANACCSSLTNKTHRPAGINKWHNNCTIVAAVD